jgi:hypothetical protein
MLLVLLVLPRNQSQKPIKPIKNQFGQNWFFRFVIEIISQNVMMSKVCITEKPITNFWGLSLYRGRASDRIHRGPLL